MNKERFPSMPPRVRGRWLCGAVLLMGLLSGPAPAGPENPSWTGIPENTEQLIVVVSKTWSEVQATLFLFERKAGKWQAYKSGIPAVLGKKGLAWGIGLHPVQSPGPEGATKKEGDLKSPAGIFALGPCMGYAEHLPFKSNLEYQQIKETLQGVDDPQSQYYNQIVDTLVVKDRDWKSYETMRRKDDLYKWLIVIRHNAKNASGSGSMIFLHVWKNPTSGTAGCTAVSEENLLGVLQWLNRDKQPLMVQLPYDAYKKLKGNWKLPELNLGAE